MVKVDQLLQISFGLLNLPSAVQAGLRDAKITMGHAKALLSFKTEAEVLAAYKDVLENQLSVRGIEEKTKTAKYLSSKTLIPLPFLYLRRKYKKIYHFIFSSG